MRPGNRDAVFEAHQLSQHFGPRNDRNTERAGTHDFRVRIFDSRRDDHNIGIGMDVLWLVTIHNVRAVAFQAQRCFRFGQVRATDLIAEIEQDFGNAAHADSANTDKMNPPVGIKQDRRLGRRVRVKGKGSPSGWHLEPHSHGWRRISPGRPAVYAAARFPFLHFS